MAYSNQGGVKNYLGKQKMVKAPLHWQSAPNHPKTELAYITDAEKKLLIKKDLHKSLKGGVNRGPSGIMSLNGWGSKDDSGREVGMSGAATSAAESGRHTSDTLAAGLGNQDLQDYRSGFIAAGGGQNVNPGWFGPRNRVSRDELRAARAFAPGAYRATRGSGIGGLLRGALGFFGGIPGKVVSGLMTAKDWAQRKGTGAWEGVKEFGEHDNLMSYLNRNKVQAIEPIAQDPDLYTDQMKESRMKDPVDLTNTLPNNLTTNMGANNVANANTAPMFNYGDALEYFTYPGTTFNKGGRVGYRTAGPVLGEDEGSENIYQFMQDQGVPFGEMVEDEGSILDQLIAKYIEAGFPPEEAEAMAMQEFEQMAAGSDEGLASLV